MIDCFPSACVCWGFSFPTPPLLGQASLLQKTVTKLHIPLDFFPIWQYHKAIIANGAAKAAPKKEWLFVQRYEHVYIIMMDGAGAFLKDIPAPHTKEFLQNGYLTYQAQTVFPTISAECYGALLHGVSPQKHGRTNDNTGLERYPEDSPYPSIFKLVHEADPKAALASFTSWPNITYGIIEASAGHAKVSAPDDVLAQLCASYLRISDPKLLLCVFDDTDHAGHLYGYNTPDHHAQIAHTDRNVGIVLDAIRDTGRLENSLVILCADHGGGGDYGPKSHGSHAACDQTIFWGCAGKGVQQGDFTIDIRDTAAIALQALGLDVPEGMEGRVPEGMFA